MYKWRILFKPPKTLGEWISFYLIFNRVTGRPSIDNMTESIDLPLSIAGLGPMWESTYLRSFKTPFTVVVVCVF